MATPIANAFKDGDAVLISASAAKPNGDLWPQAGKRGVIIGSPKPGRHQVDVPGMPLVNLAADDLTPAPAVQAVPVQASADPTAPASQRVAYAFDVLELSAIVASRTNPRIYFDETALQALADDIKQNSLISPVLVRPLPASRVYDTFEDRLPGQPLPSVELVAGERRMRAALRAGVRSVPVVIRHLTDAQVLRMQLTENIQREDLHPLEEARGYQNILDQPDWSMRLKSDCIQELADSIKKSTRSIYQTLQLLQLCDFSQKVFLEKKLQRTTALQIATIGNEAGQIEATRVIAGLARTGNNTDVIDDPMTQREATRYVHDKFHLVLSKAPFPITVTLAGVGPCDGCKSNSDKARELFDDGPQRPATCMNASCYGKKNAAHAEQLAEVARRNGQRVISGAEAKKLIPYHGMQTQLKGNLTALESRVWTDVKQSDSGQTVRQLLGGDMPNPVLIADPYNGGFVEALPDADVKRLLKERGIMQTSSAEKSENAAKKAQAEKAFRLELGGQLLAKVNTLDDADLFEKLLPELMLAAWNRLDRDNQKRLEKLLSWSLTLEPSDNFNPFKDEDIKPQELNQFIIAYCFVSELHLTENWQPKSTNLMQMSELLQVDPKAVKAKIAADAKAAEKAKADKAKAKAAPKSKPAAKTLTGPNGEMFGHGAQVRFKQGIKGPAGINRKVCGQSGHISGVSGDEYLVQIGSGAKNVHRAKWDELEPVTAWHIVTSSEAKDLKAGDKVRVRPDEAKISKPGRKYANQQGTLTKPCGPECWFLNLAAPGAKESITSCSLHFSELQIAPEPATTKPATASQPTLDLTTRATA